ncbi:tripartite tricarboxylate transporter TctB family protein [Pelagibius sp. CAU 1746]|uniref:tripartite tricarboxylate transporter TctB family protein n=1 Tax=Pelagibius sp. CAU 1746 TaxID=3140370 RepID=UPI00325C2643
MTVRTAEILVAVILAIMSAGIMWKSTELNIGWVPKSGPGGGAWPFWLATGMLLCCLWTIFRWFRRVTPQSRSEEPFISIDALAVVAPVAVGLVLLLLATHLVGMYIAVFLFMIAFVRFLGRHSWTMTMSLAIGAPVVMFCLFEWALSTPLPKGLSALEPLYYPLYDLIY